MELVDYLRVVRRRWVLVALAVIVCTTAALGVSALQQQVYEARARFNVSGSSSLSAIDEITRRQLAVQRAGVYAQFASTGPAIDAAVAEAGYTGGAAVMAFNETGSPFLTILVQDHDPVRAAEIANAYVVTLPLTVAELDRVPSAVKQELTALELAAPPSTPISPKPRRDGLVGLGLGLILGLGCAFLREALDRSYKDPDQIEHDTAVTVLGVIPHELPGVDLPTVTHLSSARAEAYRTVRTNIQFSGPEQSLKTIVITSASAGEGKTTVAANLAVAFARNQQSVVLVDADMRRPRVMTAFGLVAKGVGLAEVLTGQATLDDVLVPAEQGQLSLLPAGTSPENPSELLGSSRMAALLSELAERFEVVLIDSPPVLPVTDPLVLAVNATGVVMVVALGETTRERIKRALGSLSRLDVPLLGIVANGAVATGDAAYAGSYGYSAVKKGGQAKRAEAADISLAPAVRARPEAGISPSVSPERLQTPEIAPASGEPRAEAVGWPAVAPKVGQSSQDETPTWR